MTCADVRELKEARARIIELESCVDVLAKANLFLKTELDKNKIFADDSERKLIQLITRIEKIENAR